MYFTPKGFLVLLLAASPLASWAATALPCGQSHALIDALAQASDYSPEHGDRHTVASAGAHSGHGYGSQADQSQGCSCCDGCATLCVLSTGHAIGNATLTPQPKRIPAGHRAAIEDCVKVDPAPHSPYRPPIPVR